MKPTNAVEGKGSRPALLVALVVVLLGAMLLPTPVAAQEPVEREQMTFADIAALDELTGQHAEVLRLYWAYFDRTPDPLGALYWIDQFEQCRTLHEIAVNFTNSPEFSSTYGQLSDSEFVDLVYRNTLDREGDAAGRTYWLDLIQARDISRTELIVYFSQSREFVTAHPLPSDGVPGRPCRSPGSAISSPHVYEILPWPAFARVGPVTLLQPSAAAELIGFHESNNDGALGMDPVNGQGGSVARSVTMKTRYRDTNPRGAADIAAHPLVEIRSPVSGTVIRAGGYVLYCRYSDDYVVIEPDDRPGWEVKVLHMNNIEVRTGDRVVAGETVLAPSPNQFPFSSQIDQLTGEPSWPHVHIEVVDPSIPDRPSSGGGC